jgi:hypothetical protein
MELRTPEDAGCAETEADVLAAEDDTREPGCPVCGMAPEEHPS